MAELAAVVEVLVLAYLRRADAHDVVRARLA